MHFKSQLSRDFTLSTFGKTKNAHFIAFLEPFLETGAAKRGPELAGSLTNSYEGSSVEIAWMNYAETISTPEFGKWATFLRREDNLGMRNLKIIAKGDSS